MAVNLKQLSFITAVSTFLFACGGDNNAGADKNFNRIASFPVCEQLHMSCDVDDETAAEIVAVSEDGQVLVYTDSPLGALGFVDISDASKPMAAGLIELAGEPTSLAVKGNYALVAVNTSEDYVNVGGELAIFDIANKRLAATLPLSGQPDSIAVSPDKNYAAVVIENERNELLCVSGAYAGTAYDDEDLAEQQCKGEGQGELGLPPQTPAGELVIVDISTENPGLWTTSPLSLSNIAELYPLDPEPEYVDINSNNIAVVSLQENNHLVLVDLASKTLLHHFSAGSVDLKDIDRREEKPARILLNDSLDAVLREPDGVAWIDEHHFATADEGDLNGGSRSVSIFNTQGELVWTSGNSLDHWAVRLGHYPDGRSKNKGNEAENVEVARYGDNTYLFVNSERSNLVFVYQVNDPAAPKLKQVLPAGVAPEGAVALPSRNLLIVASEKDKRGDKIRSVLNLYHYQRGDAVYPTLQSENDVHAKPIAWSALSALSYDMREDHVLWSVEDSFFASTRLFKINTSSQPAKIERALRLRDSNNVLASMATSGPQQRADSFDAHDLAAMINDDKSVNIDAEGLSIGVDGGFWIASEGAGTMAQSDTRPIEKLNMLIHADSSGVIDRVVTLPAELNNKQVRFGFEGVAEYGDKLYVAFQRAWQGEEQARIGIYDLQNKSWSFVFYPLDQVSSQRGGWVGLSEITSVGGGHFLVLERDNQGGPDAAIKRIYKIDINTVGSGDTLNKTLVRDLVKDLQSTAALTYEKIEGLAVDAERNMWIVNDNDGVDANSGETQLMMIGEYPGE
ncbi:esterase-like activity of phytase family protein [Agaribacterium haliotis]|uniref:esterase-like activity of phytase family protein n=1 Tax=Agaribacterium haliotis TaxID=2013869 RepID=UPI000BB54CA8|nr:esterase-like activity of phytase family protein [Agaribacterium haliotis]